MVCLRDVRVRVPGEELDWMESRCVCFVGWSLYSRHAGPQKEAR